jgi:hypothetical protein
VNANRLHHVPDLAALAQQNIGLTQLGDDLLRSVYRLFGIPASFPILAFNLDRSGGGTSRMRDEIPASLLPVFHALKIASPRRLEKID